MPTPLVRDLQDIAAGRVKRIRSARLTEYARDGYIWIDDGDAVHLTSKGSYVIANH